jgi:hypothetical protein
MGMICHNAIVVTSWDVERLNKALNQALELKMTASDIVHSPTNGYCSFFVAPDGSKEGWETSDEGDQKRAAFYEFLKKECVGVVWAGVRYGNDSLDMAAYIEDSSV